MRVLLNGGTPCHPDYTMKLRELRVLLIILYYPIELQITFSSIEQGRHKYFPHAWGVESTQKLTWKGGSLGGGSRPPGLKCGIRLELEIRLYRDLCSPSAVLIYSIFRALIDSTCAS